MWTQELCCICYAMPLTEPSIASGHPAYGLTIDYTWNQQYNVQKHMDVMTWLAGFTFGHQDTITIRVCSHICTNERKYQAYIHWKKIQRPWITAEECWLEKKSSKKLKIYLRNMHMIYSNEAAHLQTSRTPLQTSRYTEVVPALEPLEVVPLSFLNEQSLINK